METGTQCERYSDHAGGGCLLREMENDAALSLKQHIMVCQRFCYSVFRRLCVVVLS